MEEKGPEADILEHWLADRGREILDRFTGHVADNVAVIDRELRIRYVNWLTLGVTAEQVLGQSALNFIFPADHEAAKRAYETTFTEAKATRFETTFKNEQGVIVFAVRVNPIMYEGEVIGAMTMNANVTEERQERIDRDRFFSLSLDMLVVATKDRFLRRVNPAFAGALGYSMEEITSRPFVDFVHPDDRAKTDAEFTKLLQGVPVHDFENRYRRADGIHRVFSWRATVDPATGDVYAVARDVTEHRATEVQLRHSQKMEAIGKLAGGIAHDFNNLMQAVLNNVEVGLTHRGLPSEIEEHFQEIASAGERAVELTKQLLVFSRQKPLEPTPLDLDGVVRDLEPLLRRLLPENIKLDLLLESTVPTVSADQSQVERVLVNLAVNARDAMEAGGTLTIETSQVVLAESDCEVAPWVKPGLFVCLTVTDTGVGMSPEMQERVFDPFFTTKGQKGGTGLGLATLYGIVQQHGGLVQLSSEEGSGSRFRICLPVDGTTASRSEGTASEAPRAGKGTLLIAEDEAIVRKPIVQYLQTAGYKTLVAQDGQQAFELLQAHQDEVVLAILDVVMPVLGGAEAWQKMKAIRPTLPVIFASGYADAQFREKLPPDAHVLDKPFPIRDLLRKIQDLLEPSGRESDQG